MEAAVLTSCQHAEGLRTPEGLLRISRAAESVFSTINRPVLGIGNESVLKCLHPDCRYPMSCDVHVCVQCIHVACSDRTNTETQSDASDDVISLDDTHVTAHYKSSGHAMFLSVEHGQLFCVACNDFVYCRFLSAALEMESNLASNFRRNFISSLSPLDPPLENGAGQNHLAPRKRNKKRRLATKSAWTSSKRELDEIAAISTPIRAAKRGVRPPVGLYNLGNSCYMNSVLQAFLNAPPLRNYFLSGRHKPTCTRKLKLECFACALDQLVCDSCMYSENGKKVNSSSLEVPFLVPNIVLDIIWRNADHLATYAQHDAHEFLIAALNLLSTHCRISNPTAQQKSVKVESTISSPAHVKKENAVLDKTGKDSTRKLSPISPVQNLRADPGGAFLGADLLSNRSSSIVQNLFSGTLQSDVVCRACGNSSPTLERFYDISLDVDKLIKPASTRRSRAPSPAVEISNDEAGIGTQSNTKTITLSISQDDKGRGKNGEEKLDMRGLGSLAPDGFRAIGDGLAGILDGEREKDLDMANSLYECLSRFTEPELLGSSSKMHCSKCGTRQEAMKQMSIRTLPPIICFHFKRFEQSFASLRRTEMVKIDTPVEFPANGLDLTGFLTSAVLQKRKNTMQPPAVTTVETAVAAAVQKRLDNGETNSNHGSVPVLRERQESLYDLFAVVNHLGKIDSGHYTAMIRRQGQWFRCDDEKVSRIDSIDRMIRSEEAYLVFYVQRYPNFQF